MTTGSGTGGDGRLRRGAELLRRHPGAIVVVALLGLVVVGVLNRASDDGDSQDDRSDSAVHQPPSRSAENSDHEALAAGNDANAEDGTTDPDGPDRSVATTTTLVPPDVARPRPTVNVDAPPAGDDPVEVARWWAATYVAYVGAEPSKELAQRLEPLTTPSLRQDLATMPPGASYSEPIPIEGVTAREPADDRGDSQDQQTMRAVVETPGALVVYSLVLERSPTGWQVGEATRL